MGTRVLVLGATRLVGVHVVRALLARGSSVIAVAPLRSDPSGLVGLGLRIHRLRDREWLSELAKSVDVVVRIGRVVDWAPVKPEATLNVLERPPDRPGDRDPWALTHPPALGAWDYPLSDLTRCVLESVSGRFLRHPLEVVSASRVGETVAQMVEEPPRRQELDGSPLSQALVRRVESALSNALADGPGPERSPAFLAVWECLSWAWEAQLVVPRPTSSA